MSLSQLEGRLRGTEWERKAGELQAVGTACGKA